MSDTRLRIKERILAGIELGESHFREFKSAFEYQKDGTTKPRPIKAICRNIGEVLVAFANADGGELLIGVEDDGTITGIPHKQSLLEKMKRAYIAYVHSDTPLPTPVIGLIDVSGKALLYYRVSNSSARVHLTSEGKCLKRLDRENQPVAAEQIQYERQEVISREYDRAFIPNASIQDLDIHLIDDIAKRLSLRYSPEKLLQFLDLAEFGSEGLMLRRSSLLLFAKDVVRWHPRCEVRIVRVNGTELRTGRDYNVIEDDTVRGNIMLILEKAWDRLRPHLARTRFQANALFRESIIYPEVACRESLINAVAHRDYSFEGKSIEVLIFDDRMEVTSPGKLLSSISVSDLRELKGVHQSRNVFVARVLRELGYMQEMGEGIRRIFTSVRDFELVDPEIASERNLFIVTLFHKSIFSPRDVQWLESFAEFDLTKDEQRVALLGRDGRLLSTSDIIQTLRIIDTDDFRALYEQLNRKGVIFSAKKVTTGRRRNIPRFQIRPPYEAQQYLAELQKALVLTGPTQVFDKNVNRQLRRHLSEGSPYNRNPIWVLQALGYISARRTPLPKMRRLWESQVLPSSTVQPIETQEKGEWAIGRIVTKFDIKGYAFARTPDGEDHFLHASKFSGDDWWKASVGSKVRFQLGEKKLDEKPRPGKNASLVD